MWKEWKITTGIHTEQGNNLWTTYNNNDMTYLLTAIGLTPGGSSTVHIYTQTVHTTTQLNTSFGRLSGIRTQSGQNKIKDKLSA